MICRVADADPARRPLRLLIVAIDGAEWEVLHPLLKSAQLPHLASLLKQSALGETVADKPMFSPILWTTMATGKKVGQHGITGFTQLEPNTGRMLPITSDRRRCKAFWNIIGEHGMRVGVVGWLATWPVERVNGVMVSNYAYPPIFDLEQHPFADQSGQTFYPPDIRRRLEAYVVPPELISATELRRVRLAGMLHSRQERYAYAKDTSLFRMAMDILEEDSVEVLAVYFQGIDLLSHWTWPHYKWERWVRYDEPTLIAVQPEEPSIFPLPAPAARKTEPTWTSDFRLFVQEQGALLENYWVYLDSLVGQLLRAGADERTYVLLVSDHGFYSNEGEDLIQTSETEYTRPTHWHRDRGVFALSGPGVVPTQNILVPGEDVLPTLLYALDLPVAQDMDGRPRQELFQFEPPRLLRSIASYEEPEGRQIPAEVPRSPLDDKILEQLRALGYVQ